MKLLVMLLVSFESPPKSAENYEGKKTKKTTTSIPMFEMCCEFLCFVM